MGPLKGIKVIEMASIGPGPFCAMLLADMGADVIRIEKSDTKGFFDLPYDFLNRGRRSVDVDLKSDLGKKRLYELVEKADILIEGYRPGVMERLGFGAKDCLKINPKLIYGRMTGWGQDGPYAQTAGHDINYISLTGVLHACSGQDGKPAIPLNMIGDFGGGAMYLAFGVLAAYIEAKKSGQGQVVDAAMVDCTTHLMSMIHSFQHNGWWQDKRQANLIDGGSPFYNIYETKDAKWVSIGAIEPKFYAILIEKTGLNVDVKNQMDKSTWEDIKKQLTSIFKSKTRDQWVEIMDGSDACVSPVLSLSEVPANPHIKAREAFIKFDGVEQPAPAPKFSRTKPQLQRSPPKKGDHTKEVLEEWGIS